MPVIKVSDTKHAGFNGCSSAIMIDAKDTQNVLKMLEFPPDMNGVSPDKEVFVLQCAKKSFLAASPDVIEDIVSLLDDNDIVCEVVAHIPRGPEVAVKGDKVEVSFFSGPPFVKDYHQIVITVPQDGEVEYKTVEYLAGRQCNTRRHRQSAWYACMACCGENREKAQKMVRWLRSATRRAIKLADEYLPAIG